MSIEDRTETIAVAVTAMFFTAFIGYIGWAEATR